MQSPAIKNSIAVGSIVNWLTLVGTVVGLTLYVGRLEAKVDAVAVLSGLAAVSVAVSAVRAAAGATASRLTIIHLASNGFMPGNRPSSHAAPRTWHRRPQGDGRGGG